MKKLLIVITLTAALNCPAPETSPLWLVQLPGHTTQTAKLAVHNTSDRPVFYIPSAWLFRALIVQ